MSEITDLTVVEIKPEQAPVLYAKNGLEDYLNIIREMAKEVPDVTTEKGRARIGSLARAVGSSKKAIENPGRAYLKRLKESVKPAEEELRRFVDACDDISKAILKPRVEWEAEQERIAAENQMLAWHEEALEMNAAFDKALAERIESDHEIALLLNEKFDRDAAEEEAEKERKRIAYEDELKRLAENAARREVEVRAQRERDEAAHREAILKAKAEQAERDRVAAEQQAIADKKAAEEKAEREKQEAIEAERRKAQETADRIKREADAREDARMAEEKRIADEAAKREADVKHRKAIGTAVVNALVEQSGITREQAKAVLGAIINNAIPHTRITY